MHSGTPWHAHPEDADAPQISYLAPLLPRRPFRASFFFSPTPFHRSRVFAARVCDLQIFAPIALCALVISQNDYLCLGGYYRLKIIVSMPLSTVSLFCDPAIYTSSSSCLKCKSCCSMFFGPRWT